mmetsp:Transcript_11096/g.24487  ORF Transcript_11096/g.24487 Transcript_11096/m.24487 type:complete len:100 (-) Transcript_11096:71-370(-)
MHEAPEVRPVVIGAPRCGEEVVVRMLKERRQWRGSREKKRIKTGRKVKKRCSVCSKRALAKERQNHPKVNFEMLVVFLILIARCQISECREKEYVFIFY